MTEAPTLTVAVTGHRPNRLTLGEAILRRRLETVLRALRSGARGRRRVAVSALAEGADRAFADVALDLGYELHALLPFAREDYETTFSDASASPAFRDLLARAADVRELPGSLADTKSAYEAVGHATVADADVLVAVWDGQGAAGRGGTPEIIAHAVSCATPVVWIDATRDRRPRHIAAPTAGGPRTVSLARYAARAKPITRRRLTRVAATGAFDAR